MLPRDRPHAVPPRDDGFRIVTVQARGPEVGISTRASLFEVNLWQTSCESGVSSVDEVEIAGDVRVPAGVSQALLDGMTRDVERAKKKE